jgi:hypothetical protein
MNPLAVPKPFVCLAFLLALAAPSYSQSPNDLESLPAARDYESHRITSADPSVEAPLGDFFGVGFGFTEKFSSALMCIDQRPGKITDPAAKPGRMLGLDYVKLEPVR